MKHFLVNPSLVLLIFRVWKGLVKEKWEGGIHKIHKGITLGDGIVFSATKLSNGMVVLLDVYQVRGFPNVQWNWEIVLLNFLQNLSLPEGYETQKYCHRVEDLLMTCDEVHFWLNGYVNKQNCRIWSEANPQVYVETPLHPEKLTVWCALWAGGILLQTR
ncbi:uncharacterized protein TNCV_3849901 [Trichonephila clavipes]|nr:uncharacterized protein TNCV_3849901 [Trichonephila clavipes]